MLTMLRAGSRSDDGSDTTEEIVRDGYPYYFKKNNGRMVMARKIPTNRSKKNFSLLGQAFGIHEPKRKASVEALRKKKKLARFPIPRPPYSTAHPPQHFPVFAPPPIPYAPTIPQQPFPNPNFFPQTNPGFPPFYPVPGFPPAPVPAPVPASAAAQQPMRWAFPSKASKPPNFEELRKVESDFLKRAKSKSKGDGNNDDHTEIKTTTTTVITKHICVSCQRDRSSKYHLDNPIKAGETPTPGFCRRCRRNATSTSGSSSDDSDDSRSKIHGYRGRGRKRTKVRSSKKNYRRKPISRVRSIEFMSRDNERKNNSHSNDHRHEIIVEEEVTRERTTAPKDPARRSEDNSRQSASRSYARTRESDPIENDTTAREEPKVRINITNRSLSVSPPSISPPSISPPSIVDELREKSVRFDQQTKKTNATSQAASRQDLHKAYRYIEPLHSANPYESLPRSVRFSKESLPSLRTKDHAQRRRSERVYTERTYDHDIHERVHEHVPRRRSDEDIIVVETEHEHPESRNDPRHLPRHRQRPSDEDFLVIETEHELPRSRTESNHDLRRPQERRHSPPRAPIRTRETYITSEVDQHGNETQYKWTTTSRTSSSLSSLRSFVPSIRRSSSDIYHTSTIRRSSDSSEEYNRAYEMAHQNLPNPGPRRRQRSSFKSYGNFMDGTRTPPRAPDPPTLNGDWDPRYVPRNRDRSTSHSNLPKVPQHQSTPRKNQAWMNASAIDQLDQRLEQNRKSRVHSRSYDSQSSGSMVTQSDSFTTTSTSAGLYEPSVSDSTRLSMVPLPVSIRDTTDSGNEVESTLAAPSIKAILKKKPDIAPSRRRYERAEITKSKVDDNSHAVRSTSQKYRDQIGSYTAYVDYGNAAVAPNENPLNANNRTRDFAGKYNNAAIFDDATDLTLRTARSKAAVLDRVKLRRRVSFQENPEYSATPKPSRENSWAENANYDAEQSYGGNTYTNDQSWDANADQSYSATSNGYQSWGAQAAEDNSRGTDTKTTGNNFWSSPTDTETVLPDIGGYSGGAGAKCNPLDSSGDGYASTPTPKSKSGTGGNGNTDGDGSNKNKKQADDDNDGWGPIPTFSSLKL